VLYIWFLIIKKVSAKKPQLHEALWTLVVSLALLKKIEIYKKNGSTNNIEGGRIYEEIGKWTRITVGKMEEMKKFIHAIR